MGRAAFEDRLKIRWQDGQGAGRSAKACGGIDAFIPVRSPDAIFRFGAGRPGEHVLGPGNPKARAELSQRCFRGGENIITVDNQRGFAGHLADQIKKPGLLRKADGFNRGGLHLLCIGGQNPRRMTDEEGVGDVCQASHGERPAPCAGSYASDR